MTAHVPLFLRTGEIDLTQLLDCSLFDEGCVQGLFRQ